MPVGEVLRERALRRTIGGHLAVAQPPPPGAVLVDDDAAHVGDGVVPPDPVPAPVRLLERRLHQVGRLVRITGQQLGEVQQLPAARGNERAELGIPSPRCLHSSQLQDAASPGGGSVVRR